jgi:hypothetical protein
MEEKVALFLFRFGKLKHQINNAPRNLAWLGKERTDLQELCFELEQAHESIARFLASKSTKYTFVTVPFENEWKEYERDYQRLVSEAAKPAEDRFCQKILAALEEVGALAPIEKSGKSPKELWEEVKGSFIGGAFDPVTDDPASWMRQSRGLVDEILSADDTVRGVVDDMLGFDDGYGQKVLGAWEFFEKTLGLDLSAIYKKWRSVPEVFIQPHVAQLENSPVVELYAEAVRSYVFGSKIASMAMCRALMEHLLKRHYNVRGKDMENVIAMAEIRYPQLKKLKMQGKRRISNDMLHDYEGGVDIEEQALIEYLRTIKYLVQNVPKR